MNWLINDPQFENSVEILNFSLELNFGLPSWLLAFSLVVLGLWSAWSVFRDTTEHPRWQRILLSLLRWGGLSLMLIFLLQPRMDVDHMVEPKSQIAVMVDNSQSMNLNDEAAPKEYHEAWAQASQQEESKVRSMTRRELGQAIFNTSKLDWLNTFQKDYNTKVYSFGERVEEQTFERLSQWPEATAPNTQVGSGLKDMSKKLEGLPLSSVILLSDGASNRGDDPLDAARHLAERGVKIYPIALGYQDAIDIRVLDLRLPDFIFKDSDVALEILLETRGLEDEDIELEIALGDQSVIRHRCKAVGAQTSTAVSLKAESVGTLPLVVTAIAHEGENIVDNNRLEKQIQVIEREIRVLIAVEGPSWEYRYLKNMLDRDPRYLASVYMRQGDLKRKRGDEQFLDRFPFENLDRNYDLIIFNNLDASIFDGDQMKEIRDFVSESGGSLMMLSATHGTPSSYAGTPIGQMLPVEFSAIDSSPQEDLQKTFTQPFTLKLTREGMWHPLTQLSPLPEENGKLWRELPEQFWWYRGIKKAKRSATVLVEHSHEKNEFGAIPLIASHSYGKGEVVYVGINSIWRWRHIVGNRYTQRFWGQAVQYLGLPHLLGYVDPVQITTAGREFELGTAIDISVRALNENFEVLKEPQIVLEAVNTTTSEKVPFPLSSTMASSGRYRGQLFLEQGEWSLNLQGREQQNPYIIKVFKPQYELQNPAMDIESLQQIAQISGGQVITAQNIESLSSLIKENVKLIRLNNKLDLWDSFLLFFLFVGFVCGEWALRKTWSLP